LGHHSDSSGDASRLRGIPRGISRFGGRLLNLLLYLFAQLFARYGRILTEA